MPSITLASGREPNLILGPSSPRSRVPRLATRTAGTTPSPSPSTRACGSSPSMPSKASPSPPQRAESWAECLRLLGAAERLRDETGYRWRFRLRAASRGRRHAPTRARGPRRPRRRPPTTEGRDLDWREAAAYARRARGERKRPHHGWASLTPTELAGRRARRRRAHQPPDRRTPPHGPRHRQDPPRTHLHQARHPHPCRARRRSREANTPLTDMGTACRVRHPVATLSRLASPAGTSPAPSGTPTSGRSTSTAPTVPRSAERSSAHRFSSAHGVRCLATAPGWWCPAGSADRSAETTPLASARRRAGSRGTGR